MQVIDCGPNDVFRMSSLWPRDRQLTFSRDSRFIIRNCFLDVSKFAWLESTAFLSGAIRPADSSLVFRYGFSVPANANHALVERNVANLEPINAIRICRLLDAPFLSFEWIGTRVWFQDSDGKNWVHLQFGR